MFRRDLGDAAANRALGLGCWAIGSTYSNFRPAGGARWRRSIRAIRHALERGVTLFDTADVYAAATASTVLGKALAGPRRRARLAPHPDPGQRRPPSAARVRREPAPRTDRIDVYLIHDGLAGRRMSRRPRGAVAAGKLAGGRACPPSCVRRRRAAWHAQRVARRLGADVEEDLGLASLNRTPWVLSGARPDALPGADDVRRNAPWWDFFDEDAMERWLERIAEARSELTADGRSLAQGALGWIWGRSPATLAIPGFRTVAQVEENVGAVGYGPLPRAHGVHPGDPGRAHAGVTRRTPRSIGRQVAFAPP